MSIPVIAFFNNKGGVGKTSLVFHLASMMAERGLRPGNSEVARRLASATLQAAR